MTEQQINDILNLVTAKLKGTASKTGKDLEPYRLADWGPLYRVAVAHATEISVHANGDFPKTLLGDTFPNETKEEMAYRQKSFQPITKPFWEKGQKAIDRVWAEQNYEIEWTDEDAKKYFTEDLPLHESIIQFFKSMVTNTKINDPNAMLVVDFELPVREIAEGEIEVDQTQALEPYATIYGSPDVLMHETGDYALFMSPERSPVQFGSTTKQEGYVLYLYEDTNIYRIEQYGKKVDWTFKYSIYYPHNLGYLPCWKLKGTPQKVIGEQVLYDSHFAPAIPHLNEAITMHSTLRASIAKVAYPIRAYYEQPCNNPACQGGMVFAAGTEGGPAIQSKCGTCSGTGFTRFSPLRDYVHSLPTSTNNSGIDQVPFPGITYVAPDSAILEFAKSTVNDWIRSAFLFLNIDVMPTGMKPGMGTGDVTATKVIIDRDEQYISMLGISNELFQLLGKFIGCAYQLRYAKESPIKIKPPTTFDLVSSAEINEQLSLAKRSGLSDLAITELTMQLMEQEFPATVIAKAKVAEYSDVLFVKDTTDIQILASTGCIEKYQEVLHVNFQRYLNELLEADKELMSKSLSEIDKLLVDKAKAAAAILQAQEGSAAAIIKSLAVPTGT